MTVIQGDALEVLKTLPDGIVQTCVTSPPYYGLRDYGVEGQIGLEQTPEAYIEKLVAVFREVRRVLKDDGCIWVNMGDSYGHGTSADRKKSMTSTKVSEEQHEAQGRRHGGEAKQLLGIPWRLAFAMQNDGWVLRQDIIWHKPNPMPESVTDRCTKAHEYIFLLSKSARYYYDADAIREPFATTDDEISRQKVTGTQDTPYATSKTYSGGVGFSKNGGRNRRSVWTVTTKPYKEAHFATFPPDLIEPCILAGSRQGDTVLDPFNGSGTTGAVSLKHGRDYIGIELNPEYIKLTEKRLATVQPVMVPSD